MGDSSTERCEKGVSGEMMGVTKPLFNALASSVSIFAFSEISFLFRVYNTTTSSTWPFPLSNNDENLISMSSEFDYILIKKNLGESDLKS